MRKNLVWFLLIVIAVAIQATWLEAIRFRGVMPDIMLLLVVYFAMNMGSERAMWTGALGGIFQDVAANASLGHHVLCNVVVGYTVGRVGSRLVVDHPAVKAGVVFLAGLAHGTLYSFIGYVQDPQGGLIAPIMSTAVPAAFYTALMTPFVFVILDWSRSRYAPMPGGTN
jgi:rod shape-determining protein MreD